MYNSGLPGDVFEITFNSDGPFKWAVLKTLADVLTKFFNRIPSIDYSYKGVLENHMKWGRREGNPRKGDQGKKERPSLFIRVHSDALGG